MSHSPSLPAFVPWEINELTANIFKFMDNKSLARCARVNRRWAEIALDLLWRSVDDISRVLNILCRLVKHKTTHFQGHVLTTYVSTFYMLLLPLIPNPSQKFQRLLTANDWGRLERYSHRIRVLTFEERSVKSHRRLLDQTIFSEIERTCPTAAVCPNLQSLTWDARSQEMQNNSLLFMQPRINRLAFRINNSDSLAEPYLQLFASRLPRLTHLTLYAVGPMRNIESRIIALLRHFHELQSIVVPLYGTTTRIVEELSRLPCLLSISLGQPVEFGRGDSTDIVDFCPTLTEGAFQSVRKICISAQLPNATRFIADPFFPHRLTSLYVHAIAIAARDDVRQFFMAVVSRTPAITTLHLDFIIYPHAPFSVPGPPTHERPNITTFRPLFACRHMKSFEFRWDYALNLTDQNMEEFAVSWPALEHFMLNSEPVIEFDPPPLTLAALVPFAQHCPMLQELGLYVDADALPSRSLAIVPFKSLQKLFVGASKILVVDAVALFLSQLCALECEVVTGLRWPDAYGIALDHAGILDERRARMSDYWVRWNELVKVLPVVTRARMEEKARLAALQRELDLVLQSRAVDAERCQSLERQVLALRLQHGPHDID
ncbi:uncharacterized protein FIBRA_07437 [Fibroporia radiculosa]|uniref:F-box domain-containing protein n=1 Tax=Fibroporia radiculosa TaxID=599839 RepID=J4I0P3_9APHY|nr:uncharacterized protein FIBRA_07437 [Fibroporia radiculosa]CCM05227.1 predicted protein [Fibroporia radiculosa]